MAQKYMVEPDIGFINEVMGLGGDTLKKCFQCATCSVACPISPEDKPFPRKEMIAASWGLKDKLVGSADIWLCHQCGDCTTMCPRGAAPGDVLGAIRSYAITEYAQPKFLGKMVNDKNQLLLLTAVPAAIFAFLAFLTVVFGGLFAKLFGGKLWYHTPDGLPLKEIAASKLVNGWLVDLVFVPLAIAIVVVFALGLKRFIKDIHENAVLEGKTERTDFNWKEYLTALVKALPTILKHKRFTECGENRERALSHMMVLYSFIGLFIVTAVVFFGVYFLGFGTPYSQLNPIKWLANVSGVVLIIGITLMIKDRYAKKTQKSSYKDWYLLIVIAIVAVTGMLTQMFRLGGVASLCYLSYYIHLIAVFHLFAYLPFSKLAHFVYRTAAMGYQVYSGRK